MSKHLGMGSGGPDDPVCGSGEWASRSKACTLHASISVVVCGNSLDNGTIGVLIFRVSHTFSIYH